MNALAILGWAITGAQVLLGLAMCCAIYRVARGPRAQDRMAQSAWSVLRNLAGRRRPTVQEAAPLA